MSVHPSLITSVYGPQAISAELEEQLELDLVDEGITVDDHRYYVHIASTNLIECDEAIIGAMDKASYDFISNGKFHFFFAQHRLAQRQVLENLLEKSFAFRH